MLEKFPKNILIVSGVLALLLVLLAVGHFSGNAFFAGQVEFILIFACMLLGGWVALKLIQRS